LPVYEAADAVQLLRSLNAPLKMRKVSGALKPPAIRRLPAGQSGVVVVPVRPRVTLAGALATSVSSRLWDPMQYAIAET
jgi:hypothetical protein